MSIDKMQDLQEERNRLASQIQELGERQADWSAEDREKWDVLNSEYDRVDEERNATQEALNVAAKLDALKGAEERANYEAEKAGDGRVTEAVKRDAMRAWALFQSGVNLSPEQREAAHRCGVDPRQSYFEYNLRSNAPRYSHNGYGKELRAQATSPASAGGNLIPEGFSASLEQALLQYGGIRRVANVMRTASGNDLPMPTVNDTSNKGALLAENTQVSEQDVTYGSVTLGAYKLTSKLVRISSELMQDAAFDMGSQLGSLIGERLARGASEYFVTGTGSSEPQGVVTGSSLGVTAASATAVTFDEIIDLINSVDPAYQASASFGLAMNNSTKAAIRKLKDSNGQYLWQAGLTASDPDTILGKPVVVLQEMASIATGNKTILAGDMSKFVIRDAGPVRLARMDERYRDYDQTGFVAFSRVDSIVIDAGTNPIKHLIQA